MLTNKIKYFNGCIIKNDAHEKILVKKYILDKEIQEKLEYNKKLKLELEQIRKENIEYSNKLEEENEKLRIQIEEIKRKKNEEY